MRRTYACMPPISASLRRRPSQPKFIPGLSTLNEIEEDEQDDVHQPVASVFSGDSDSIVGVSGESMHWSDIVGASEMSEPEADYSDDECGENDVAAGHWGHDVDIIGASAMSEPDVDYSDTDVESDYAEDSEHASDDEIDTVNDMQQAMQELLGLDNFTVTNTYKQANLNTPSRALFGKKLPGYCIPLVLKWLTGKGNQTPENFFEEMKKTEEINRVLSLSESKMRDPNVLFEYIKQQGFSSDLEDGPPKSSGLYWIAVDMPDQGIHALGLHIKDESAVSLFDPNTGEFSFESMMDFNDFFPRYLTILCEGAEVPEGSMRLQKIAAN